MLAAAAWWQVVAAHRRTVIDNVEIDEDRHAVAVHARPRLSTRRRCGRYGCVPGAPGATHTAAWLVAHALKWTVCALVRIAWQSAGAIIDQAVAEGVPSGWRVPRRVPLGSRAMPVDVSDATFETEVLARSEQVPVVVDLWAPWCGPCRMLGPILEKVVAETEGAVALVKVNVDENPRVATTFQVQSIPAVYAISQRRVVDQFIGALPEAAVRDFVSRLVAPASEADLLAAAGDEASLRKALEIDPGHEGALVALAEILVERGEAAEALSLLARVPETAETRRLAARARLAESGVSPTDGDGTGLAARLDTLLEHVRDDPAARQQFLDLLETLPDGDPRRTAYRKALASRLY